MSARNLLVIAVVGIVGFFLYKKFMMPSSELQSGTIAVNPAGGAAPQASSDDLFTNILRAATTIANAIGSVAQTTAKSS